MSNNPWHEPTFCNVWDGAKRFFSVAVGSGTLAIGRWACTPDGMLETGKEGSSDGEDDSGSLSESDGDADPETQ